MLELFSWGYAGWGNSTQELVQACDAIEAARGFGPPLFVDVRARRQVRALGFREDVFERQLGPARYHWMPGLGNEAVRTGQGEMRLSRPGDVKELLTLAFQSLAPSHSVQVERRPKAGVETGNCEPNPVGPLGAPREPARRVIFFCSCPAPTGFRHCHRRMVALEALRAATELCIQVRIQEWLGGTLDPERWEEIELPREQLAKVRKGAKLVALGSQMPGVSVLSLPHGSPVLLRAGEERQWVSVESARFIAGQWRLPLALFPVEKTVTREQLLQAAARWRQIEALEPRESVNR